MNATRLLIVGLSLTVAPATGAAQTSCVHETFDGGELVFHTSYHFDRRGRVVADDYSNDRAAFTTHTVYRRDARGELNTVSVRVLEGPTRVGQDPPIRVTHERSGASVVVEWSSALSLANLIERWEFDARGLPARVRTDLRSDGEIDQTQTCAHDLLGRPVLTEITSGSGEIAETRWLWAGGRLAQIRRTLRGREAAVEVRHRGRDITFHEGSELVERWTGDCSQVLFGSCSPRLTPLSRPGRIPVIPSRRRTRPRTRTRARPATAFVPALRAGVVDLALLRRHYRGRVVFTSATFGENDPSHPIPIVCVGSRLGECMTVIHYDQDRRLTRMYTHDPTLVAATSLRVGMAYREAAPHLRDCQVRRGLEEGIVCQAVAAVEIDVWLDGLEADPEHSSEGAPTAAMLARARVVHLEWMPA